jgi:hypothetical protein
LSFPAIAAVSLLARVAAHMFPARFFFAPVHGKFTSVRQS